jgi:hypothetical protein
MKRWTFPSRTSYSYDGLNRMSVLYEGALGSTVNMVSYGYNSRGGRASQSGRYGQLSSFGYDAVNRTECARSDRGQRVHGAVG